MIKTFLCEKSFWHLKFELSSIGFCWSVLRQHWNINKINKKGIKQYTSLSLFTTLNFSLEHQQHDIVYFGLLTLRWRETQIHEMNWRATFLKQMKKNDIRRMLNTRTTKCQTRTKRKTSPFYTHSIAHIYTQTQIYWSLLATNNESYSNYHTTSDQHLLLKIPYELCSFFVQFVCKFLVDYCQIEIQPERVNWKRLKCDKEPKEEKYKDWICLSHDPRYPHKSCIENSQTKC